MIGRLANGVNKLKKRIRNKKVSQKAHRKNRRAAALAASEGARTSDEAAALQRDAYDARQPTEKEVAESAPSRKKLAPPTALGANAIGALGGLGVSPSAQKRPSQKKVGHQHRAKIDHFGVGVAAPPAEATWEAVVANGAPALHDHHKRMHGEMKSAEEAAVAAADANLSVIPHYRPQRGHAGASTTNGIDHLRGDADGVTVQGATGDGRDELRARLGAMLRAFVPQTVQRRVSVAELRSLAARYYVDRTLDGADAIGPLLAMCARSDADGTLSFDNFVSLLTRSLLADAGGRGPSMVAAAPIGARSNVDHLGNNLVASKSASQREGYQRPAAGQANAERVGRDHLGVNLVEAPTTPGGGKGSSLADSGVFRASPPERAHGKKIIGVGGVSGGTAASHHREAHGILPWAVLAEESTGRVGDGLHKLWKQPRTVAMPGVALQDHLGTNLMPRVEAFNESGKKQLRQAPKHITTANHDHLAGGAGLVAVTQVKKSGKAMIKSAAGNVDTLDLIFQHASDGADAFDPKLGGADVKPVYDLLAPAAGVKVVHGSTASQVVRGKRRVQKESRTAAGFLLKSSPPRAVQSRRAYGNGGDANLDTVVAAGSPSFRQGRGRASSSSLAATIAAGRSQQVVQRAKVDHIGTLLNPGGDSDSSAGVSTPRSRGYSAMTTPRSVGEGNGPTSATPNTEQRAAGMSSAKKSYGGRSMQMSGQRTRSLLRWASTQSDGVVVKAPSTPLMAAAGMGTPVSAPPTQDAAVVASAVPQSMRNNVAAMAAGVSSPRGGTAATPRSSRKPNGGGGSGQGGAIAIVACQHPSENILSSLRRGLDVGADAFEFVCRVMPNGALVVVTPRGEDVSPPLELSAIFGHFSALRTRAAARQGAAVAASRVQRQIRRKVLSMDDFFLNLSRKHVIRFGLGDPSTSTNSLTSVAALRLAVDDLGVNLNSSELETVISYLSHVDETNEHGAVIDTNAFGQLAAVAAVAAMKSTDASTILTTGTAPAVVDAALHLTIHAPPAGAMQPGLWEQNLIGTARGVQFGGKVTIACNSLESLKSIGVQCPEWKLLLSLRDPPLAASDLLNAIAPIVDGIVVDKSLIVRDAAAPPRVASLVAAAHANSVAVYVGTFSSDARGPYAMHAVFGGNPAQELALYIALGVDGVVSMDAAHAVYARAVHAEEGRTVRQLPYWRRVLRLVL